GVTRCGGSRRRDPAAGSGLLLLIRRTHPMVRRARRADLRAECRSYAGRVTSNSNTGSTSWLIDVRSAILAQAPHFPEKVSGPNGERVEIGYSDGAGGALVARRRCYTDHGRALDVELGEEGITDPLGEVLVAVPRS